VQVRPLGVRDYELVQPGLSEPVRITCDRAYFDAHSDSVELWSPGSPVFTAPDAVATPEEVAECGGRLAPILVRTN
jgi:hypothetical protein